MTSKTCLLLASLFGFTAVACGAFGAHGLKDVLDAYGHEVYHKAFFYHLTHALGIILIVLVAKVKLVPKSTAHKILLLFLVGILLFSGSLYTLALTGIKWLGAITPFGGIAFIIAWLWLAFASYKHSKVE